LRVAKADTLALI